MAIVLTEYVQYYLNSSDFPPTGNLNNLYIDASTNLLYRWTGSEYIIFTQFESVATYADLPPAADHNGEVWLVTTTTTTGVFPYFPPFGNTYPAGFYISNGTTWTQIPATAGAITYADLSGTAPLTYDGAGGFSTEISSGVLVGRSAPGAGVMQEIGLANGLFLDGGDLGMLDITPRDVTASGTITGDNLSGTNRGDVTLDTAVSFIFLNPPSSQNIVINPVDLSLSSDATGILAAGRFPALTGDLTTSAGSLATTLATVNSNVGSFGSATQVPVFTVNGKGLITAVTNTTISGVSPGGSAGGDLSGTYPNPTVAKINGVALGSTTATSGNILLANGSAWVSSALSSNAVTSISGTSNQINASASVGAVTLSLSSTIVTPGTLAVNGTLRSNSSTTLNATGPYNLSVRGTQTTDTGGTLPQAGILIESIFSSPNTLASAIGGISNISRFIAASAKTLSLCAANYASVNCSGNVGTISILSHFYSDGFVAAGGTVSAAYGFYGKDPNTGTLAQAAYFDNLSVGYPSANLKATNNAIFVGNVSIGSSSLTSLFNVGSSNQFQINTSGVVVGGTWQGTAIDGTYINYNTTNLKVTTNQLNTIQDIATSSTVQFAKLGLGVAASNNQLSITGKASIGFGDTSAPTNGLIVSGKFGAGTSSIDSNAGCQFGYTNNYNVEISSTQNTTNSGYQLALYLVPVMNPTSGATGYVSSVYSTPSFIAPTAQTINNAANIYAYNTLSSNVGTISNAFGLLVDTGSSGAGTITNHYGGYFAAPTAGTNKAALYADNLTIGYTAITPPSNGVIISGPVGIGNSSVSSSALLELSSTTKGFRLPNMTTTQKNNISSPVAGLMVFDTTLSKACVYSGTTWETITSI